LWNSRRYDEQTDLYYYWNRHYKADIGSWLGRDPIEEKGGYNLYGFVNNEPLMNWDMYGNISRAKCKELASNIENLSSRVALLKNKLRKLKCKVPKPSCIFCCNKRILPFQAFYIPRSRLGKLLPRRIWLCYKNINSTSQFIQSYQHKLVHAVQDCEGRVKHNDCDNAVCNEIQAYLNDGGCSTRFRTPAGVRDCVERGADGSARVIYGNYAKALRRAKALYSSCSTSIF